MRYAIVILILFSYVSSDAQLKNTTWRGTFAVPQPLDCIITFSGDTSSLILPESGEVLEMSKYRISGDTLYLRKLSGGSPCGFDEEGTYTFKVDGKKLFINPLLDACDARRDAFPAEGLEMIEP